MNGKKREGHRGEREGGTLRKLEEGRRGKRKEAGKGRNKKEERLGRSKAEGLKEWKQGQKYKKGDGVMKRKKPGKRQVINQEESEGRNRDLGQRGMMKEKRERKRREEKKGKRRKRIE